MWEVEYTAEFGEWWETLSEDEQDAIDYSVGLLENEGPSLKFPHSSNVRQSKHDSMRELRSQCKGQPLGTFYAFNPCFCVGRVPESCVPNRAILS